MSVKRDETNAVRDRRYAEASRRVWGEGVPKSKVAADLGVSRQTLVAWEKAGKIGAHKVPPPPKRGRPAKIPNVQLPPLKIRDLDIQKAVDAVEGEGAFSHTAARKYEELWFRLTRHLDHIVEHSESDQIDPKAIKDWIDTLQRLSERVEAYRASAKPEVTADQLTVMKDLQARRERLKKLYTPKDTPKTG